MNAARFALDVLLAWLMPWRAARRIREQRESIDCLVNVLSDLTVRERPGRPGLYRVK